MPGPPQTPPALESEPEPVPELTISHAASTAELIAAHKLIADSIAQQRATLVRSLLYGQPHLTIPPYILLLSWLYAQNSNVATALLLSAGCTIAILSLCGRFADDYIEEAEKVGSTRGYEAMMESGREVVVARWGPEKEVIGVAVTELQKEGKGGRGVVWALAVRLRYRKHGVGRGLLEEVVKVVRKKFGDDADVLFADAHTNSFRIKSIPKVFNKAFDKHEKKIRAMLEDVKKTQSS